MIIIEGSKPALYQWDLNQRLELTDIDSNIEVHFSRIDDNKNESLVLLTYEENGRIYANIPNIFLQERGVIYVYIYVRNENEMRTKYEAEILVLPREKPADYIYTETETKTFEALEKRIEAQEKHTHELASCETNPISLVGITTADKDTATVTQSELIAGSVTATFDIAFYGKADFILSSNATTSRHVTLEIDGVKITHDFSAGALEWNGLIKEGISVRLASGKQVTFIKFHGTTYTDGFMTGEQAEKLGVLSDDVKALEIKQNDVEDRIIHKYENADVNNSDFYEETLFEDNTGTKYTLFKTASEESPMTVRVSFIPYAAENSGCSYTVNGELIRFVAPSDEIAITEVITSPIFVHISFGTATFTKIQYYKGILTNGTGNGDTSLPTVTTKDNGKVLTALNGVWVARKLPTFDGAFEVIPMPDSDVQLKTAGTYMDSDITVKKIPYNEVSNETGGTTVTIGGNE